MTNNLIVEFRTHLDSHLIAGQDGNGQIAHYYPRAFSEGYWTKERVRKLLDSYDPPFIENDHLIATAFPRIFSILVYIGQPRDITLFLTKSRDDHHLPFDELSLQWLPSLSEFLEAQWMFCPLEFTKRLILKRHLPTRQILPVSFEKPLREERKGLGTASITKVRLHPECNSLIQGDGIVVFKIYEGSVAEDLYITESDMYSRLSDSGNNSITRFYGSFSYEQTQRRIIILEYAEGGSLFDYFQAVQPPVLPDEFEMLWSRLLDLLDGLHTLHNQSLSTGSGDWHVAGVHMDIQPANILVFPQPGRSRFDVLFKLVDFGMSAIRRLSTESTLPIDNEGNRMYSAPECYANHPIQDIVKANISTLADVWALGAVFSDVFTWSIRGQLGREHYRSERKTAIDKLSHLYESGYDACFHDGSTRRLPVVDWFHDHLLVHTRRSDFISHCMNEVILDDMLTEESKRLLPLQIKTRAQEKIQNSQQLSQAESFTTPTTSPTDDSTRWPGAHGYLQRMPHSRHWNASNQPLPFHPAPRHPRRSSGLQLNSQAPFPFFSGPSLQASPTNQIEAPPDQQLPESSVQSPSDRPPAQTIKTSHEVEPTKIYPAPSTADGLLARSATDGKSGTNTAVTSTPESVSVERAYSLLEKKYRTFTLTGTLNRFQSKQSEVMGLLGMQEARIKVQSAGGRDQIMVIDNFSSMAPHWDKVIKMARVVSYVTKVADSNGMDLIFASDPTKSKKCYSSREIETAIKKMNIVEGTCNMGNCLDNVKARVLGTHMRPTSIYVYTDAIWEPGNQHGVDSTVRESIKHLVKIEKPPQTLMFQFIQFGNDVNGTKRLRELDDDYAEKHGHRTYDIVDTKHCDDNVPDIIVGSISGWVDKKIGTGMNGSGSA